MSKAFENLFCDNCHNLLFPTRVKAKAAKAAIASEAAEAAKAAKAAKASKAASASEYDIVILECKICFAEKEITPGQRVFYSKSFTTNSRKNQFDNSVIQYDYTLKRINLVDSGHDGKSKEYVYVLDSNLKQTIYETDFEPRIIETETAESARDPMQMD